MMAATELKYSIKLGDLIAKADQSYSAIDVYGLTLDSRHVSPGDVFLACSGTQVDGRDYIDQALTLGAAAVLIERDSNWSEDSVRNGIPLIVVEDLVAQLSAIAGRFYGHPSKTLPVIAVTGTNGKTSCTQLLMQLLNRLGEACGVIGTLGVGVNGVFNESPNTTPDAITIQRLLAQWQSNDITAAAMEVSSHGLKQGRVAALQFELALFTNLSRDHLDYHGSMQSYAEAKASLFSYPGLKTAVINADDSYAQFMIDAVGPGVEVLIYSICGAGNASVWVENIHYHSRGVRADLHSPWGQFELESPLLGAFNLSNVVAVICCLGALAYPISIVINELASIKTIDGRMERLDSPSDLTVVVDYAHTPDALEKALVAMRQHTSGQLWCVFGCGGDRDQGKRPQMGAVVQRHADHVVVTSDNPRTESAADIINQILGGVDSPGLVEEDRGVAIDFVIANASAGDSILIAGKGHEDYQLVGEQRIPFSDGGRARLALAKRVEDAQRGKS